MARKCPECHEVGRAHLAGCSYAPDRAEREAFIRANAVSLVRQLEEKVRRQAEQITKLENTSRCLRAERDRLQRDLDAALETMAGKPTPAGMMEMVQAVGLDRLAQVTAERDKLAAFKTWVHQYLDGHGVPHHPPGTHGAAGCRIGDRMDWLMDRLRAERERGEGLVKESLCMRCLCCGRWMPFTRIKPGSLCADDVECNRFAGIAALRRELSVEQESRTMAEEERDRRKAENAALRQQIEGHAARIADQSDQLSRRAEVSAKCAAMEALLRRLVAAHRGEDDVFEVAKAAEKLLEGNP